jgi:colicin import membrane protein
VDVLTGSGNALFDDSAVRAVFKADPLPLPTDPKALADFKNFNFVFNPED